MPALPFHGDNFWPISQSRFELLRGTVFRFEREFYSLLVLFRLDADAEGKVACVKRLLLREIGGGEGPVKGFGDDSGLVILISLPENHIHFVEGEVLLAEQLYAFVGKTGLPPFAVALLNPLPVSVS